MLGSRPQSAETASQEEETSRSFCAIPKGVTRMIEAGLQEFAQARAQIVRELAEAAFEKDSEADGKRAGKIMASLCKQQEVANCMTKETWTRLFDNKIVLEESLYGDVL